MVQFHQPQHASPTRGTHRQQHHQRVLQHRHLRRLYVEYRISLSATVTRYREYWGDVQLRFIGLYDVVGSFGVPGNRFNLGKRLRLPSSIPVKKAVHVMSENFRSALKQGFCGPRVTVSLIPVVRELKA